MCAPILFAPVSPINTWNTRTGLDDDELLTETLQDMSAIRVGAPIKQRSLSGHQQIRASLGTFIREQVDRYYARSIATQLPGTLAPYSVRYYQRLTFVTPVTSSSRERCMSFHSGDIFMVGLDQPQYFSLDSVALPTIQSKRDVFLIAYRLEPYMADPILKQNVYTKTSTESPVLLHVTNIVQQYPHFIPYEPSSAPADFKKSPNLYWHNEWYIPHY